MQYVKKLLKARGLTSALFLVALFLVVGAINPSFLTPGNISACFNTSVVYTLVAVGMAFTLFIGEIDVSVGANIGLVAAVVGTLLRDGQPLVVACGAGHPDRRRHRPHQRLGRRHHEGPVAHLHAWRERRAPRCPVRLHQRRLG